MLFSCAVVWVSLSLMPPSPASLSRRELGLMTGQAGLAVAASFPHPALAGPSVLPYQQQPGIKLNTGQAFPYASFGLQVYDDATAQKLTTVALKVGYRNFFASVLAGNQRGFARAIKDSGIPRDELFICGSVLSNRAQGYEAAKKKSARGCEENMEAFSAGNIDYLDMIMVPLPSWPVLLFTHLGVPAARRTYSECVHPSLPGKSCCPRLFPSLQWRAHNTLPTPRPTRPTYAARLPGPRRRIHPGPVGGSRGDAGRQADALHRGQQLQRAAARRGE